MTKSKSKKKLKLKLKLPKSQRRALQQEFYNLLCSGVAIKEILAKYDKFRLQGYIASYYGRVKTGIYGKNALNYGMLGSRFQNFVLQSGLFEPSTIQKFAPYFGQYGDSRLNLDKIIKITSSIIQNPIQTNNSRNLSNQIDFKIAGYKKVNANKLFGELYLMINVNQQLNHLLKNVRLSQDGAQNLFNLRDFLQSTLQENVEINKFSPKLVPFGGLVNGLGMYDSDIDMLVKFQAVPAYFMQNSTLRMQVLKAIEIVYQQKIRDMHNNLIVPSDAVPLVMLDFEQMPGFARKLESTGLCFNSVDLNVNGLDGIHNSAWLKFLTEHDERFKVLTLLLKYFGKQAKFIGKNGFSSYSFTAKVIFFLQNTNPIILPSFDKLQSLASEPIWVNEQNFAFSTDHSKIPKSSNQSTIQELVVEFFDFYNNFDYDRNVVNAQSGRIKSKDRVTPNEMVCYDPFTGGDNIASRVTVQNQIRWKKSVKDIADRITEQNCVLFLCNPRNLESWST